MMELVGSSAGGSSSGSADLKTHSGIKSKCLAGFYLHDASYKKPKKPVGVSVVDSSAGLLCSEGLVGSGVKPIMSWTSNAGSVASSIGDLSDLDELKNMVVEETSYVDSGALNDENIDKTTHRKFQTWTYMFNKLLAQLFFDNIGDDDDILELPP
ncbi:hypothetical protein G9A89_008099 [Geosiphon pyriformis]|nr:hypothetical protein G9A89_008099 [Geosiphon pyriformis]